MTHEDKLRLLYIGKLMYELTDEEHYLTSVQISKILEERYGITAYRSTVKQDIDILTEFGMDIETVKSTQNRYYLVSRTFDIPELKLLIDAVESSKFITKQKSKELVKKLGTYAGQYKADELKRNLRVDDRFKTRNEKVYLIVDAINEAINLKRKISFKKLEYNEKKKQILHNNGEEYIFSPYSLVWDGDYYYVVGFSDKHREIGSHRVDRIYSRPELLDEKAVPKPTGFDMNEYVNTMFRMFNSPRMDVELLCENDVMDAIVDRFGARVATETVDTKHFRVTANIAASHVFFSWVFGFAGKVKITGPEEVKEKYKEIVLKNLEALGNDL